MHRGMFLSMLLHHKLMCDGRLPDFLWHSFYREVSQPTGQAEALCERVEHTSFLVSKHRKVAAAESGMGPE